MKHRWNKYLLALLFSGMITAELFAAGTPAGTVIQSRSRVTYATRSGSLIDTVYSAYVSFTVAQKGAFNITPASNAITTQSDSTAVDYAVLLINSGNGNDRAKMTAVSSKGWETKLYHDQNSDGVLQSGELTAGVVSQSTMVAADAAYSLIIRVFVPRGEELNGIKDTIIFISKSNFDSTKTNIGRYITLVRTTGFTAVNSGLIVNDPTPAAGQQVTYTFTLTNNGSIPANAVTMYNVIPNGLSVVSVTTLQGTFISSASPIIWNIGTLSPSQTISVTVTMKVDAGVVPGTIIPNQIGIQYTSGQNTYAIASNVLPITVSGKVDYGVEVTPLFSSLTKEASDTAWYRFKIKNTGSSNDLIELSHSSTQSLLWTLYRDANNNSVWDPSDPLLANTNDSAGIDIGSVKQGDSVRVFAAVLVPRLSSDLLTDTLQIQAASSADHSKSDSKRVMTTVKVPMVTINKSIFPIGNLPAGSVITYTISYSNAGSVGVNNFAITDAAPSQTNYLNNSIKVNGVAVSDNGSGISISKDQSDNTVIAVSIGALAAKSNGSVEFKVKVK